MSEKKFEPLLPLPLCDALAGWIGGAIGVATGHPLDTVKVQIQANPHKYKGFFDCSRQMIQAGGFRTFFNGLTSPVASVGPVNSVMFAVHGVTTRWMKKENDEQLTRWELFVVGNVAGLASCFVTTPMDLVKCRLQASCYTGVSECVRDVWKTDGVLGFFRGLWPTIVRDTPTFGFYFCMYEEARRYFAHREKCRVDQISTTGTLVSGGAAGVICWSTCYPIDVCKTRIQTQMPGDGTVPYKGLMDCLIRTYRTEGFRTLFKGMGPCVVRAAPVNAVTFFGYEVVMKFLTHQAHPDHHETDNHY
eukprot:TRINITY_DN18537_c0_g1::TRINITY_DN18537_c0_g1_i1::g.1138::m.1138 TRINITY_DN18537_c0_g1::TRINITY_DN18537_c0_g1_i1::g.1138  ORF type:complete len:304 (+),score=42.48,sp/Q54BM3/MCFG_DICDI/35.88/3e-57,Mito_carr/PF00153.22/1.7e-18,Mito_carr/PF00153.22/3.2e-23,Mito_carr/PF00153.22/1.1e-24 TRINITY_DN18537_c0_g1_i1:99-1010(+)